jgi:hypothetical protein
VLLLQFHPAAGRAPPAALAAGRQAGAPSTPYDAQYPHPAVVTQSKQRGGVFHTLVAPGQSICSAAPPLSSGESARATKKDAPSRTSATTTPASEMSVRTRRPHFSINVRATTLQSAWTAAGTQASQIEVETSKPALRIMLPK